MRASYNKRIMISFEGKIQAPFQYPIRRLILSPRKARNSEISS